MVPGPVLPAVLGVGVLGEADAREPGSVGESGRPVDKGAAVLEEGGVVGCHIGLVFH